MLKKMSIKKILVSSTAIILLLIIYLIPDNKKDIDLKNSSIEYNYNNVVGTIYLVDSNDYVARTTIPTCKCDDVALAKDLVEGLIIGGAKNNIIPNGFRSILPPDVVVKDINLNNILSYTTYYTSSYNNNKYYVPVTKYVNSKDSDIVKVIIKELGSSPIYETNLMSYLNTNATLNNYELAGSNLILNFNEQLLNDIDKKNILEEVIYTISLSMDNIYDNLETVSFQVNNEEISTVNIKDIK